MMSNVAAALAAEEADLAIASLLSADRALSGVGVLSTATTASVGEEADLAIASLLSADRALSGADVLPSTAATSADEEAELAIASLLSADRVLSRMPSTAATSVGEEAELAIASLLSADSALSRMPSTAATSAGEEAELAIASLLSADRALSRMPSTAATSAGEEAELAIASLLSADRALSGSGAASLPQGGSVGDVSPLLAATVPLGDTLQRVREANLRCQDAVRAEIARLEAAEAEIRARLHDNDSQAAFGKDTADQAVEMASSADRATTGRKRPGHPYFSSYDGSCSSLPPDNPDTVRMRATKRKMHRVYRHEPWTLVERRRLAAGVRVQNQKLLTDPLLRDPRCVPCGHARHRIVG